MGIAGVPSASIIIVILIVKSFGIPAEFVGVLFAVDRFIDMFRSTGNMLSATSATVLVAKLEGEKDILKAWELFKLL